MRWVTSTRPLSQAQRRRNTDTMTDEARVPDEPFAFVSVDDMWAHAEFLLIGKLYRRHSKYTSYLCSPAHGCLATSKLRIKSTLIISCVTWHRKLTKICFVKGFNHPGKWLKLTLAFIMDENETTDVIGFVLDCVQIKNSLKHLSSATVFIVLLLRKRTFDLRLFVKFLDSFLNTNHNLC